MRRWTVCILAFLFLGAITTVAVALGASQLDRPRILYPSNFDPQESRWIPEALDGAYFGEEPPTQLLDLLRDVSFGLDQQVFDPKADAFIFCGWTCDWIWTVFGEHRNETETTLEYLTRTNAAEVLVHRAGWPARALQRSMMSIGPGAFATTTESKQSEIMAALIYGLDSDYAGRLHPLRLSYLPLRPLWPGFAIDTLFYAAIWFGVFFGFASAKRAIRRKRGRCPRCGYDLRGQRSAMSDERSARCSECGWNRGAGETERQGDGETK